MLMTSDNSIIIQKTRELCQSILDQPEFQSIRRQVDAFLEDSDSQSQYSKVVDLGDRLHQKQHSGMPMTNEEVDEFDKQRTALLKNPVTKGFLEAQEAMQQVQSSVNQYVAKTFELGRLPAPEDFESGSCGPGCGCEH